MKREDLKKLGDPAYREYAEDLSIWREGMLARLPPIRRALAQAREAGDVEKERQLDAQHREIVEQLEARRYG